MPIKVPRFSIEGRRGLLALVLLQASARGASAAPEGPGVGKPPEKKDPPTADGTRENTPGLRWSGIGYVEETPPLDDPAEQDAEATKSRRKDTIVVDPFRQTGWVHLGVGTGSMQLTASQPRVLVTTVSLHLQGREPGMMMVPWLALNPHLVTALPSEKGRPGPEFPAILGGLSGENPELSSESALMPGMNAHGGLDFHFMRNPYVGFGPLVGLRYRALFWSASTDQSSFHSNKAEVGAEWGLHLKARIRDDAAAGDSALIAEISLLRRPFTLFTATYLTAQLRLWRYLSLWFETPLEAYRPFNTRDTRLTPGENDSPLEREWETGSVATSLLGTNAPRTVFGLGVTLPFSK